MSRLLGMPPLAPSPLAAADKVRKPFMLEIRSTRQEIDGTIP